MKKIISILGSMLLMTAVKAQTTGIKKETVKPGGNQTIGIQIPPKDPKATGDPKKEAAAKEAAERAAKDAKIAQQVAPKAQPAKDPKAAGTDPKTIPAKDPKAAGTDPKKEAAAKAAAEREAKNANILHKGK